MLNSLNALICALLLGACSTTAQAADAPPQQKPAGDVAAAPTVTSVLGIEPLKVYKLPFKDQYPSGPFEILSDRRFLFIGKCGQVYFTKLDAELKLTAPLRDLGKTSTETASSANGKPSASDNNKKLVYCKEFTGVKDSLLANNALFVAYSIWDDRENAIRLAVSEFTLDRDAERLTFKRDIYVSRPAIKEPILGNQLGGRMALGENDHTLFLAVGDFSRPEFVQDKNTSLGKVVKINLKSLKAEVYATGIRSPSGGLYYDRTAHELWLTDHGPQGGDEINLIKRGRNYGWPEVSYGTMYERGGMGNYYGNNQFNTHDGFAKPAMTFVPSIGVGTIARYPASGKNEYWENDYFVAAMGSMNLLRIRKEGEKLVYAEPVLAGYRIRGLKFDSDGNFYIKTDHDQFLLSDPSKKRMP